MDVLTTVTAMLGDDAPGQAELSVYIDIAKTEILNWLYRNRVGGVPDGVQSVPQKYEVTQVYAVLAGYNLKGAENQSVSVENGIHRHFEYSDMLSYIRANVIPYARLA